MPLIVHQFPCLSDNYGFLLHDPESGKTTAIDTPDADEILRQCETKGWTLTDIWNTHHHWDHTGGNIDLKEKTGCFITGPKAEAGRIPGIDLGVKEGDVVKLGTIEAKVWDTPAHTAGHISYYFAGEDKIFVGDTLFALGCGRLFEGTPAQMHDAMTRYAALPDNTQVYCAHEYTLSNGKFALTVEPDNQALIDYMDRAKALREDGIPTVPTTIGAERAANPFMRASSAEKLGEIRAAKDKF